jgi:hypothetical protein
VKKDLEKKTDVERWYQKKKKDKKWCQSLVTFQTCDPSHQTEGTIYEKKIMKPNP